MEEKTKKRGWVKDAAIIFLAVLLVLTFFSSTILNRSLPEVATVYVTDGTITTKVRGTGTVIAKENYDVTIEQSRKVQSVLVRVGDEVLAGDVLFVLQAGDSTELEAAQEQLASLQEQYQRMLLNASSADYAREDRNIAKEREELNELKAKAEELAITPEETEAYEKAYAEALELVNQLQAELDSGLEDYNELVKAVRQSIWDNKALAEDAQTLAEKKQALVDGKHALVVEKQEAKAVCDEALQAAIEKRNGFGGGSPSTSALESASNSLNEAKEALDTAQRELQTQYVIHGDNYNLLIKEARAMMEAKYRSTNGIAADAKLTDAQKSELKTFQSANLPIYLPAAAERTEDPALAQAFQAITAAENAVASAQKNYNSAMNAYDTAYYEFSQENQNNAQYRQAQKEVDAAQERVDAAAEVLKQAEKEESAAQKELDAANAAAAEALEAVSDAQSLLTYLESGDTFSLPLEQAAIVEKRNEAQKKLENAKAEAEKLKTDMEARKAACAEAEAAVEAQQEALENDLFELEQRKKTDGVTQQLEALDRQKLLDSIEKQKALIEELSGEDGGTEVKARVAGTIQSISVSAGHEAMAGAVLATIEVPDLGYTLNFSVTNEQARRLRVGDTTSVSNYYWGSEIIAKLVSIKTDPQNPQGSKLLTFDITGDVTPGSSLSLSVGDKNANYDMVVPNSAIRSDVNGSFVLKITAKNSPLGNRYYATRVDVNVVSSDEKYSAISGAIESYDSVITTASGNAPISAGDQVRLADTNS